MGGGFSGGGFRGEVVGGVMVLDLFLGVMAWVAVGVYVYCG